MHAGGFQSARELLGQGRGLLGGVHALLQRRPGRLPALQPLGGLLVLFLGGARFPFQVGPFAADLGAALFGALRRAEGSQGLAQALLDVGQLLGARFPQRRRELRPGGGLGVRGGQVRGGGRAAQFQGGGDQGSASGPVQQVADAVPFGCGLGEQGGPPEGLRVEALQPVEFPRVLGGPPGGGVPALDGGQRVFGDVETLAGRAPGDGRPGTDGLGESGVARLVAGHRPGPQVGAVAGGLGEPLGGVQHLLVAGADLGLGGPAALAEQGLDGGEAAGVEEPAEQAAAGRLVGAQELRELPLREQHDLAELLAAHAEQLLDLLADLLVGAAERLPALAGVLTQSALGLVLGGARAAFLRAFLFGPPGDLQPASARGEFEGDLGRGVGGGVVAAQAGAGGLAGAGYGTVEGVADGVEHGGLPGAGGSVQQEDAGAGQGVEIDLLGFGEGSEGGHGQAVQPHRWVSRWLSSARTSSKAPCRTARSASSAWPPPRTWATKSSAISWSLRPLSRWA